MKAGKLGKKLLWPCSIALLAFLAGCAIYGSLADSGSKGGEAGTSVTGFGQSLDELYFPKDKVIDVKVTIDPDKFQSMLNNPLAEELMEASVDYNGEVFDNVAIRTKGNLSLTSVARNNDSDRYSFKISFDEYVNQTLGGISKVNLNNGYSDASYMREFLAYELAETLGLPTPKYSFVQLYVNDELKGLYLAIEQIGDAYLERHFGTSAGALYKANGGNGSELTWLETIESYTGLDAKQGKADDDSLLHMLDVLNNGSDYESVLNVDHALGYFALNVAGGNFDSYHSDKKHNYYLFGNSGIYSILPWDFNMAFGGFGSGEVLIDEPTTGALADRPLIAKLLAVDAYKERYHEMLKETIQGYLSEEAFAARVGDIQDLISDKVQADPTAFVTFEQFQQGVQQLISYNASNTAKIADQLDGTSPSAGDGSGMGGGMGGGMGRPRGNADGGGFQGGMGGFPNMDANAEGGAFQGGMPNMDANAEGGGFQGGMPNMDANAEGGGFQGGMPNMDANGYGGGFQGGMPNMDANAEGGGGFQGGMPNMDANANGGAFQGGMPNMDANANGGGFQGGMGRPDRGNFDQGGGFQGGMGGMGGFPGNGNLNGSAAAGQNDPIQEATYAGIALILLLLSCLVVVWYRRNK
ncbi:CotH kinase family protein [Paenibacillus sp. CAU 1782]